MGNRLVDDEDLLLTIAKEKNGYGISNYKELNYSACLEKLFKEGFLEFSNSQESNLSTVNLTLWGLFRVLAYLFEQQTDDILSETLDKIANAQAQKLIIFKKWPFL